MPLDWERPWQVIDFPFLILCLWIHHFIDHCSEQTGRAVLTRVLLFHKPQYIFSLVIIMIIISVLSILFYLFNPWSCFTNLYSFMSLWSNVSEVYLSHTITMFLRFFLEREFFLIAWQTAAVYRPVNFAIS